MCNVKKGPRDKLKKKTKKNNGKTPGYCGESKRSESQASLALQTSYTTHTLRQTKTSTHALTHAHARTHTGAHAHTHRPFSLTVAAFACMRESGSHQDNAPAHSLFAAVAFFPPYFSARLTDTVSGPGRKKKKKGKRKGRAEGAFRINDSSGR